MRTIRGATISNKKKSFFSKARSRYLCTSKQKYFFRSVKIRYFLCQLNNNSSKKNLIILHVHGVSFCHDRTKYKKKSQTNYFWFLFSCYFTIVGKIVIFLRCVQFASKKCVLIERNINDCLFFFILFCFFTVCHIAVAVVVVVALSVYLI